MVILVFVRFYFYSFLVINLFMMKKNCCFSSFLLVISYPILLLVMFHSIFFFFLKWNMYSIHFVRKNGKKIKFSHKKVIISVRFKGELSSIANTRWTALKSSKFKIIYSLLRKEIKYVTKTDKNSTAKKLKYAITPL